jgi:enamine deaminase RidA (YjgF/YER057c/UK114 family)
VGVTGRTPAQYLAVAGSTHLAKPGNTLTTLAMIAWQRAGLGVVSKPATSAEPETRMRSPSGTKPNSRPSSMIGIFGRSAQGDHGFDPAAVVYDEKGLVVSDGNKLPPRSMADETRSTLRNLEASLAEAGCTLEDVVDTSVWLRDPRDFAAMNEAYAEFFKRDCPTRSIFRIDFMFDCRIEIKVTAYKPLKAAKRKVAKAKPGPAARSRRGR